MIGPDLAWATIGVAMAGSAALGSIVTGMIVASRMRRAYQDISAEEQAWDTVVEPLKAEPPIAPEPSPEHLAARPAWGRRPPIPAELGHLKPGEVWWCSRGSNWNVRNDHACCQPARGPAGTVVNGLYAFTPHHGPVTETHQVSRETSLISHEAVTITDLVPPVRLARSARPPVHQGPETLVGTVVMAHAEGGPLPAQVRAELGAESTTDAVEQMLRAVMAGSA